MFDCLWLFLGILFSITQRNVEKKFPALKRRGGKKGVVSSVFLWALLEMEHYYQYSSGLWTLLKFATSILFVIFLYFPLFIMRKKKKKKCFFYLSSFFCKKKKNRGEIIIIYKNWLYKLILFVIVFR